MDKQNDAATDYIDNKLAVEALRLILEDVTSQKKKADQEVKDDLTRGRRLAYFEMLDIIEARLEILDIHLDNDAAIDYVDNKMADEALMWILEEIIIRKKEADQEVKDDFTRGRRLAYSEMLDTIEARLEILNIHLDYD